MSYLTDILIVTVTEPEVRAVRKAIARINQTRGGIRNVQGIYCHDLGTLHGQQITMIQTAMGSGSLGASQQATQRAVQVLKPAAVIMVGIAFGLKKDEQIIGEVLVATHIANYEPQRIGSSGKRSKIIWRGGKVDVSPNVLAGFKAYLTSRRRAQPKASPGVILSGEKLVDNKPFLMQLKKFSPEAIGGEMEGAGLYVACQYEKVDWILVKAICDWGFDKNQPEGETDPKKASQIKDGYQKKAARNAANLMVQTLCMARMVPNQASRTAPGLTWTANSLINGKVVIFVRGNLKDFNAAKRKDMIAHVARSAGVEEHEVELVSLETGSVIITLRMPMVGAERLLQLWQAKSPELVKLHITGLKIEAWKEPLKANRRSKKWKVTAPIQTGDEAGLKQYVTFHTVGVNPVGDLKIRREQIEKEMATLNLPVIQGMIHDQFIRSRTTTTGRVAAFLSKELGKPISLALVSHLLSQLLHIGKISRLGGRRGRESYWSAKQSVFNPAKHKSDGKKIGWQKPKWKKWVGIKARLRKTK